MSENHLYKLRLNECVVRFSLKACKCDKNQL